MYTYKRLKIYIKNDARGGHERFYTTCCILRNLPYPWKSQTFPREPATIWQIFFFFPIQYNKKGQRNFFCCQRFHRNKIQLNKIMSSCQRWENRWCIVKKMEQFEKELLFTWNMSSYSTRFHSLPELIFFFVSHFMKSKDRHWYNNAKLIIYSEYS